MPTFEKIKWMPPTITLINTLVDLGYDITYITIYPDEYYQNFDQHHVKNISLCKKTFSLLDYCRDKKILSSIAYRIDVMIEKFLAHRLRNCLGNIVKPDDILWVVNEMTVMYAGCRFLKSFDKYIFTMYELHGNHFWERNIKKAAQNACMNIVPEYNRAHIQKCLYALNKTPVVLPNKPMNHPINRNMVLPNKEVFEKIQKCRDEGKKIIMYMGIISEERPLEPFIQAISESGNKYQLMIIGRESSYLNELKNKYPTGFQYLGFFTPPDHLAVASHSDIGLLIYVDRNKNNGMNALFCAPNKIFEYTGFGMPVIANDIPGLHHVIKTAECGTCVDLNDKKSIIAGIETCIKNYEKYSNNAKKYFDSVEIPKIVASIIESYYA